MPTTVDIPGVGSVDFPDSMSQEQIVATIQGNGWGAPDPRRKAMSNILSRVDDTMKKNSPEAYRAATMTGQLPDEGTDNRSFVKSAWDAGTGVVKGLATLPTPGPTLSSSDMQDLPVQTVGTVDKQVRDRNYTGAAGTLLGTAAGLGTVGLAAKGIGMAADKMPAVRNKIAGKFRSSAEKDIYSVLDPTTKPNKAMVYDDIAPDFVKNKTVATSLESIRDKAEAKADIHGANIDAFFEDAAKDDKRLSAKPIIDSLENEKQAYTVDGEAINPGYVNRIQELQDQITQVAKNNGGEIPVGSLRRIRQIHDAQVAKTKGGGGWALPPETQTAVDGSRHYSNAIRSTLADAFPELADENREFSLADNTRAVADATIRRKVGQSKPMTRTLFEIGGAGVGSLVGGWEGALIGKYAGQAMAALQRSPFWKTLSAAAKSHIADLIEAGDEDGATFELINHGLNPEYAERRRHVLEQATAPRGAEPSSQVGQIPGEVPQTAVEQQALRESLQARKPQPKVRANSQPPQQRTLGLNIKAAGFGEEIPGATPGQQAPSRPSGIQPLRNGAQDGPPRRIVADAADVDPDSATNDSLLEQQALRESRLHRKPQANGLSRKTRPMMAVGGTVGKALRSRKR